MRAIGWVAVLVAVVLAAIGATTIVGQAGAGQQPWDSELSDNFVFARTIPLTLGLGVALGLLVALARLASGRVFIWLLGLALVAALPTGLWQYLGGVLDKTLPIPLYLVYRTHYLGATVVLLAASGALVHYLIAGDRRLLVARGEWRVAIRGAAPEMPARIDRLVARIFRVDLRSPAPGQGRFAWYDRAVSLPLWSIAIGLITVTGLVKALRYLVPVPGPLLYVASTLHVAAMVLIVVLVLDELRLALARRPLLWKRALAVLAVVWALANLVLGALFVTNAVVAKTLIKEGLLAQTALFVAGLAVLALSAGILWRCVRIFSGATAPASG